MKITKTLKENPIILGLIFVLLFYLFLIYAIPPTEPAATQSIYPIPDNTPNEKGTGEFTCIGNDIYRNGILWEECPGQCIIDPVDGEAFCPR